MNPSTDDIIHACNDSTLLGPNLPRKVAWIRWPDEDTWKVFFHSSGWLLLEWVLVYGGANWITGHHAYRVPLRTGADFQLPFVAAAAIVYLSLFAMLWLSPFILHTTERLRSFARALGMLILISGLSFVLMPTETIDVDTTSASAAGPIYEFADWINLTHNYFPSLHVGMAVLCAASYCRFAPWSAAILFSVWAAAIALSTLFLHQHYIADVLAGGALGLLMATFQRRSSC